MSPSARRRLAHPIGAVAFVGAWMTLGLLLGLDANAYLLAGIPLTVAYQRWALRRPLRELWVRHGELGRVDLATCALAGVLAVLPVLTMIRAAQGGHRSAAIWAAVAAVGAVPAARTLRRPRRAGTGRRPAFAAAITAVVIGCGTTTLGALAALSGRSPQLGPMVWAGLASTLLYLPALFMIEEVTFRGCLDRVLHDPPPEPRRSRDGLASAAVGSALWGVWHLPLVWGSAPAGLLITQLIVVHGALGVPLTLAWRRGGDLALPVVAHAVVDGVRNALLSAT